MFEINGKKYRRENGTNCIACFSKDCDCECETCLSSRERNRTTDSQVLHIMNMTHAIKEGKKDA